MSDKRTEGTENLVVFGVINVDKPVGMSSARVVSRVKRLLPRGTKIGHAGTLDPFASGVLLLLVGKATKLCEQLMDQPKRYEAMVKLGAVTATDDLESEEEFFGHGPAARVTERDVEAVVKKFVGEIDQVPPVFSAMKVGGRRAYEMARRGEDVRLEARKVKVYGIEVMEFAWPVLKLRVDCGRGTYVRALARDIGAELGVGGYLTALRRTRIGAYEIQRSVTLERLATEGVEKHLRAV